MSAILIDTPDLLALAGACDRLGLELALNCRVFQHHAVARAILPEWLALCSRYGQSGKLKRCDHCARANPARRAQATEDGASPSNEIGIFENAEGNYVCLLDFSGPGGPGLEETTGPAGERLKLAYALEVPPAVASRFGWTSVGGAGVSRDGTTTYLYESEDSMQKRVEITVAPDATVKLNFLEGFQGSECEQVADAVTRALGGTTIERTIKPEYQQVSQSEQESVSQGAAE